MGSCVGRHRGQARRRARDRWLQVPLTPNHLAPIKMDTCVGGGCDGAHVQHAVAFQTHTFDGRTKWLNIVKHFWPLLAHFGVWIAHARSFAPDLTLLSCATFYQICLQFSYFLLFFLDHPVLLPEYMI